MHLPHNFLMAPSVVEAFLASHRPDREGLCLRTRSLLVRRRRECQFLLRSFREACVDRTEPTAQQ